MSLPFMSLPSNTKTRVLILIVCTLPICSVFFLSPNLPSPKITAILLIILLFLHIPSLLHIYVFPTYVVYFYFLTL